MFCMLHQGPEEVPFGELCFWQHCLALATRITSASGLQALCRYTVILASIHLQAWR